MKKIVINIACASLTVSCISFAMNNNGGTGIKALAPANALQESAKICYVDPYKIIPNLAQWTDERGKIQKELETRTKQIEDLKNSYTKKAQELQSMGNLVKDSAKEAALKELKRLETNIQIEQQSFQEYAERASQEAQMAIFREIEAAAKEYAQQNSIDFIFAGGAIYVNGKFDISETISELMNKRYLAGKKKEESKKS